MKLKLLIVTIALAFSSGYTDIGIGVKGGLSLYKAKDDRSINFYDEYRLGPEISLFCEIMANKFLFHNIMLTYYQAGGKTTFQGIDINFAPTGVEYQHTLQLDYIGIGYGLGFKVKLLNVLPYLSAGISLDYLINTKEEIVSGETVEETHMSDNSKFKKFNIRPFFTGGLEYKIFKIAILAEYTFAYGLLPYYKQDKTAIDDGIKYKTLGHFINLGLKLYI